ncbi:MAG: peptide deformylase [Chloroflexi bacterium]|nr:peptide deformylase [Chloroflexota bacterium]
MAVLQIRVVPDPVLRRKARPVKVIDEAVRRLACDMIETMQAAPGVGLAANQVGVLLRVVTLQMPDEDPFVMINPVITHREGTRTVEEGCLSVPGYVGSIERSVLVRARFIDERSGKHRVEARELLAQAIEHEIDHLNGILYLDHLKSHEDLRQTVAAHEHEDVDFSKPPDLGVAGADGLAVQAGAMGVPSSTTGTPG